MRAYKSIALLFFALLVTACGGGGSASGQQPPAPASFTYTAPQSIGDGWATGHMDDHGIDSALLIDMMNAIVSGQFTGIDAVVIVRDNTLVLDAPLREELDDFDGWIDNTSPVRHIMHSTSKSVTSALIGIAIDQGYIASTEVPFYSLFSYPMYENWDPRKDSMTLQDALTMRLGIEWDEWSEPYGDAQNDLQVLTSTNIDYSLALLNRPLESDPGTTFTYNTAATIAIGQALENAVGVPMADYAEMHLFAPLQITTAEWGRTPTGLPNGGSGLFLEPRDMVKFGQLFIDGGVWNGEQIISSEWIEESVQQFISLRWTWTIGYGYQWWLDNFLHDGIPLDSWSTRGYGGQYIFCIPELNLVVAFTGQNYESGADIPYALMRDYILPAVTTSQ